MKLTVSNKHGVIRETTDTNQIWEEYASIMTAKYINKAPCWKKTIKKIKYTHQEIKFYDSNGDIWEFKLPMHF